LQWDVWPCPPAGASTRLELEHFGEHTEAAVRAIISHGPGRRAWEEVPASGVHESRIHPIVRLVAALGLLRAPLAVG
jgi:hypothetical protein